MMNCPSGPHILGQNNADECTLCTRIGKPIWDELTKNGRNYGYDPDNYYELVEAAWLEENSVSPDTIVACVNELSEWLGPQECRKHECVENRAEIARHHKDFARISALLDEIPKYGGSERVTIMMHKINQIRNIVG